MNQPGLLARGAAWLFLCATLLGLSACQPAPQPTPLPTPVIVEVQVTPALYHLSEIYQSCANEQPGMGLVLLETSAAGIAENFHRATLYWGEYNQPPAFAAVFGEESLVLIVHPDNPLNSINLEELRSVYRGEQTSLAAVDAWAYPAGEDTQRVFEGAVMQGEVINAQNFSQAAHPAAMREIVAGSRTALGFLPRRWVDDSVKPVSISGLSQADLSAPVLALKNAQPHGLEKDWLLCVQEKLQ